MEEKWILLLSFSGWNNDPPTNYATYIQYYSIMKNINIISLNILGKAELLVSDHQKAMTAFRKIAIQTEGIELEPTGFSGDMVKDTKHHGGNDKAICCYNADHFEEHLARTWLYKEKMRMSAMFISATAIN